MCIYYQKCWGWVAAQNKRGNFDVRYTIFSCYKIICIEVVDGMRNLLHA